MDCIFCKIINGEIPANIFYQDEKILAFHDINPQAPVHLLIIPKKHIETLMDITPEDSDCLAHIFAKLPELARKAGLEEGFRIVGNCKAPAGQAVFHIHFHLLGKRNFSWPPG